MREQQLFFIYLLADAQGSGAGRALLDRVLGEAPATLWVLEGNDRGVRFYERNVFVLDGVRQQTGFGIGGHELRMLR